MKTLQRPVQIVIDTPKIDGNITIRINFQNVDFDEYGNIKNETPTIMQMYKFADKVAIDMVDVYDPVKGENIQLSVAGLHHAICTFIANWVGEDNPNATINGTEIWL